jgi:hypothetical protein
MQGLPSLNFNAGDITRGVSAGIRGAESKTRRKLVEERNTREQGSYDTAQAGIKAQRMISILKAGSAEEAAILNSVHNPGTRIKWQGENVEMRNADGTIVSGPKSHLITMQKMIMAGGDPKDAYQYAVDNGVLISNPQQEAEQAKTLEGLLAQSISELPPEQRTPENIMAMMGQIEALQSRSGKPPLTFEGALTSRLGPEATQEDILNLSRELNDTKPVNTIEAVLARKSQNQGPQGPIESAAALTSAKKTAEVTAKKTAEAKFDVGKTIDAAEQSINIIQQAIDHPGRETATGASGTIDPRNYMPGTDATNFRVVLDQIKGKAFLQAFQNLKGGGQITEAEGQKATEAMARLNTKQSDDAFLKSLQELMNIVQTGVLRARQQASGLEPAVVEVGTIEAGYKYIGGDPGDPNSWEKVQK